MYTGKNNGEYLHLSAGNPVQGPSRKSFKSHAGGDRAKLETPMDTVSNRDGAEGCAERFNQGKPELSYMMDFPNAMRGMARVMEYGAKKYDRNNWKKGGLTAESYMDSLLRHMMDWKEGKIKDDETGEDQLYHIVVNALMLAEMYGSSN